MMDDLMNYNRRRYLAGAAAMTAGGLTGCVGAIPGFGSDDSLGEPEESRGSPSHATYGDEFDDFSVPDALSDAVISRDDLLGDPLVLTFIYTNCQDRCGELMGILQLIQRDAKEEGWVDDVTLAAMTWDPDRDDPETLREYAEAHGIDVDHDQFYLLRPEDNDRAIDLVDEQFGVPAQHGDHDHHDHDDGEAVDYLHYYMIFLVDGDGTVKRSYPGPILFDRTPDEIVTDVQTVAN